MIFSDLNDVLCIVEFNLLILEFFKMNFSKFFGIITPPAVGEAES